MGIFIFYLVGNLKKKKKKKKKKTWYWKGEKMSVHHRITTASSMHQSASAVNLEEANLEVEIDVNVVDSDVVGEDELALLNEEDKEGNEKEARQKVGKEGE